MTQFIAAAKNFIRSEDAPTMVEYGLMVSLIAIIAGAGASILGSNLKAFFSAVAHSV